MKKKIRTDLLRELANHLLFGKLGHKQFLFCTFNNAEEGICGTAGCAAGECPILWPDEWEFATFRSIKLKNISFVERTPDYPVWQHLEVFFCVDENMVNHLFCPSEANDTMDGWQEVYQTPDAFGGEILGEDATKEEVAKNILAFCDLVDAGKITLIK